MKNKKIMIMAIATIMIMPCIIISSNLNADSVSSPIDLSSLDYLDYEYVLISSTKQVNLTFITSEYNQASITVEQTDYYPGSNETKYRITSNIITPDSSFNPSVLEYVFQDDNTGQLYLIAIDYTSIDVPLSSNEQQIIDITEDLEILQSQYDNITGDYADLQTIFLNINTTLQSYNDSDSIDSDTKATMLLDQYNAFKTLVDTLEVDLNTTTTTYNELIKDYSDIMTNNANLTQQYTDLNNSNNNIKLKYETINETYLNMSMELSQYKAFINALESNKEQFYFPLTGEYYRTPYSYGIEIESQQKSLNQFPTWIIFTMILVGLGCFVLSTYYIKKIAPTPVEYAAMGYSPTAEKYDNFIIDKCRKLGDIFKINKKQTNDNTVTYNSNTPDIPINIPEPTKNIIPPEMDQKIDQLLSGMGAMKTDIGTISQRLDHVETSIDNTPKIPKKTNKKSK